MNILNKIILSFVLPALCLLISVSYASEFVAGTEYFMPTNPTKSTTTLTKFSDDYTKSAGSTIIGNYISDSSTYASDFKDLVNSTMAFNNFDRYVIFSYDYSGNAQNYCFFWNSTINDIACFGDILGFSEHSDFIRYYRGSGSAELKHDIITGSGPQRLASESYTNFTFFESNSSIKYCEKQGSTDYYVWDGVSYVYEHSNSGSEEDIPAMPTNSEIASVVQSFYNSDYYKNNKDFKEFFVLYNSLKGIYSFIGHNSVGEIANHFEYGSTLSQIVYSDDYPSNIYGLSYWKFALETLGSQISNFFNNYYWLYSSYDNGETITYDGKGYVTDLVEVEFDSRYSTIVYSSTNYLCRVYDYENEEETNEQATIPGNQYTHDETLDPTTNEYNPIKDYIPTDPTQSTLGDVDFDEINKVFEENKDILNIENASWLFSANNQLINYFIGFLSFLIVLIIISRLLGG